MLRLSYAVKHESDPKIRDRIAKQLPRQDTVIFRCKRFAKIIFKFPSLLFSNASFTMIHQQWRILFAMDSSNPFYETFAAPVSTLRLQPMFKENEVVVTEMDREAAAKYLVHN